MTYRTRWPANGPSIFSLIVGMVLILAFGTKVGIIIALLLALMISLPASEHD